MQKSQQLFLDEMAYVPSSGENEQAQVLQNKFNLKLNKMTELNYFN